MNSYYDSFHDMKPGDMIEIAYNFNVWIYPRCATKRLKIGTIMFYVSPHHEWESSCVFIDADGALCSIHNSFSNEHFVKRI